MTAAVKWYPVAAGECPEGVPVHTRTESGQEAVLVQQGRLWFFEDMSMYVYYTPAYWRPKVAR